MATHLQIIVALTYYPKANGIGEAVTMPTSGNEQLCSRGPVSGI